MGIKYKGNRSRATANIARKLSESKKFPLECKGNVFLSCMSSLRNYITDASNKVDEIADRVLIQRVVLSEVFQITRPS